MSEIAPRKVRGAIVAVPAVPPTRLSAEVPVVTGAGPVPPGLGVWMVPGPAPPSAPVVTGPMAGDCASLRPSSAIWAATALS